jgi:hypothetical protein
VGQFGNKWQTGLHERGLKSANPDPAARVSLSASMACGFRDRN